MTNQKNNMATNQKRREKNIVTKNEKKWKTFTKRIEPKKRGKLDKLKKGNSCKKKGNRKHCEKHMEKQKHLANQNNLKNQTNQESQTHQKTLGAIRKKIGKNWKKFKKNRKTQKQK